MRFSSDQPLTLACDACSRFVDETKAQGLVVVAAVLNPRDLAATRTAMRCLFLPRQSHVHFVKEKTTRKNQIIDAICDLHVQLDVYDATATRYHKQARRDCLVKIVENLARKVRTGW